MSDKHLPLPTERDLFSAKQVEQSTIEELSRKIIEINNDDEKLKKIYDIYGFEYRPKPIKIYIDSYGGEIYSCLGLISIIENSKTAIHTIVTGTAMSCGFMILISGHKRFAHKNSTVMYHQASTGFWGKIKDMKEDYDETKRLQSVLESIVLEKTKIKKEDLKKVYNRKKDWYIDSKTALKLKVVDETI